MEPPYFRDPLNSYLGSAFSVPPILMSSALAMALRVFLGSLGGKPGSVNTRRIADF